MVLIIYYTITELLLQLNLPAKNKINKNVQILLQDQLITNPRGGLNCLNLSSPVLHCFELYRFTQSFKRALKGYNW